MKLEDNVCFVFCAQFIQLYSIKSFRLQPENETIASKHDQTNVKERQIKTVPRRNIMNDMQRLP